MKKLKYEKGITLIALAVTVVVMLIIAGVSISSMTGQNNTIDKANNVKEAVDNKEELDAIRIAIQEALNASRNGKLDKESLKKYLEQHLVIVYIREEDDGTYTFRAQKSGNTYSVNNKGEFVD